MEYKNLTITAPNKNGDGLVIWGSQTSDEDVSIKNCTIDFSNMPCNKLDENISFVKGARAEVENCLFTGGIKLALCGNGDYPVEDNLMNINFKNCVFKDFGRRGPEAQDGALVRLENCVIWNWGTESRFDVRSFAGWAHSGARIVASNCVFIQDKFFQCSLKNMIIDILNHIGNDYNDGCLSYKSFIPGVMKGLFSTDEGSVVAYNELYKNRWVYIEGSKFLHRGSKHAARRIIHSAFTACCIEHLIPEIEKNL